MAWRSPSLVFIAQSFDIHMSLSWQALMRLILMASSKGWPARATGSRRMHTARHPAP